MSVLAKAIDQPITEELLRGLVGELVHAVTNELELINPATQENENHNVWFAGRVVGFQRTELFYDYIKDEFTENPDVSYMLMLSEGSAYMLSDNSLELRVLEEEEFIEMVAVENANRAIEAEAKEPENLILFPEAPKLYVPGRGM